MELTRPCRPGPAERQEIDDGVNASRSQVLLRRCKEFHGLRSAVRTASDRIFAKGLYLLLAIVLLHDIFAPHPFGPTLVLSNGSLSVQALDTGHSATVGSVEEDENTSVPNGRGTLIPVLFVDLSGEFQPFFHPLFLIAADERPPKA